MTKSCENAKHEDKPGICQTADSSNLGGLAADWNQTVRRKDLGIQSPGSNTARGTRAVGKVHRVRRHLHEAAFVTLSHGPATAASTSRDQSPTYSIPKLSVVSGTPNRKKSPQTTPTFVIRNKSASVVKRLGDPSSETPSPTRGTFIQIAGTNALPRKGAICPVPALAGGLKNPRLGSPLVTRISVIRNGPPLRDCHPHTK